MCRPALLLFAITLAQWCQLVECQYDLWHAVDEAMVVCDPIPKPSPLPAGMTDSQWPTQKAFPVEIKYDHGMDIDQWHVVTFFRQHPGRVNITFDVKDADGATVIERTTVKLGVPVSSDCKCTGSNGRAKATYGAEYGKSCGTWDASLADGCALNSAKCCDAWCYVSADCKDAQSSVLNPGAYYSYEGACSTTASATNCQYADQDPCGCTSVDNLEPYASSGRIAIEGANYGATCGTWSYEKACNDPQLFSPNETDLWCCQSWCWVKSGECRQAIPSKKYPGLYWAPDFCPDDPKKVNTCPFKASTGNEVVVTPAPSGSLCECLGYRPKMLSSGRRRMSKAWASNYGATCMAHDKDFCAEYHPQLDRGIWCCQSWCYVDEECPSAQPSTLAQGFFYSYETCPDDRQNMADCSYSTVCKPSTTNPIDSGRLSRTVVSPSLPTDYGKGCGAWDKDNCFDWWSGNANVWVGSKDWCCDSWTYVDTECPMGEEGSYGMSLSYALCVDSGHQTYDVANKQCITRRLEEVKEDSDTSHVEGNGMEDKEDELEETSDDEDDEVADDEETDRESEQDELLEGEEDEDAEEYEQDDEGEAEETEDGNEDEDEHHDEHDSAQEDELNSKLPQARLRALASSRRRQSRPSNPGRRRASSRPSSSDTRRRQAPPAARRRSPSSAPTRRRQVTGSSTTSGRRRAGPAPTGHTPQRRRQPGPSPSVPAAPANDPRRRRTPAPTPAPTTRRRSPGPARRRQTPAQAQRRRAPATSSSIPTRRRQVGTDGRVFSAPARRRSPSPGSSSSGRRRATIGYTNPATLNNNYNGQMPSKTAYGHTGIAKPAGSSAKIAMAAAAGVGGGALLGAGAYYAYSTYQQDTAYGQMGVPFTDTRWATVPSGPEQGRMIRWDHCQQAFGAQCKDLSDCYGDDGCEHSLPRDTIRDDLLSSAFLPADFNGPVTLTVYEISGTNSAWHKASICVPVPNSSTLANGDVDPTWLKAVTVDTALYVTVTEVTSLDNSAEGQSCVTDTKFPCQNSHSTCGNNEQCTGGACECKPGWCLTTDSVGGKSVPACTRREEGFTSLASSQAGVPIWLMILCLMAMTFLRRRA